MPVNYTLYNDLYALRITIHIISGDGWGLFFLPLTQSEHQLSPVASSTSPQNSRKILPPLPALLPMFCRSSSRWLTQICSMLLSWQLRPYLENFLMLFLEHPN